MVVGAGPAGSATAARLAERGHRVLLLDRERFPRRKPCGDCVNPAAVRALDRLGALDRVLTEPHSRLRGWTIRAGCSSSFAGDFPAGGQGIAVARERLDAAVLEHARSRGVEIRTGVRVVGLLAGNGGVEGVRAQAVNGPEEIRGRLVIGADGLRSVVVRRLGLLRRGPRLRKIALTARVRGTGGTGGRGELQVHSWGTVGLAEIGGGAANLTLVLTAPEAGRIAGRPAEYFDEAVGRWAGDRPIEREGPVLATGPFDWPTRSAIADGALLVGDAAGYFDPFTGQGIYRALRAAEMAVEVAAPALAQGDLSARRLAPYESARQREFGPGRRLQHVIEAFAARPRLFERAVARLGRRSGLADALIGVTGDLLPVRSLLLPALRIRSAT